MTIRHNDDKLQMEVAFSGGDYDPNEIPHALIAYCWDLVRQSSDQLAEDDRKAQKGPSLLLPKGVR